MTSLCELPRALVIQGLNHDDRIAWLRPYALIQGKYVHKLPNEEVGEFGVDFDTLIAIKGLEAQLKLGDAFRTFNPADGQTHEVGEDHVEIIGEYLPEVDTL